jgi:iron complex transport system substrate-binding protein
VSLAPSLTEVLFAIGAGDHVVGVTDLCDRPPAVRGLPRVGGITSATLRLEAVVALRPDLVVAIGSDQEAAVEALAGLGLRVEVVPSASLGDVLEAARRLGEMTGRRAEGSALAAGLGARVAAVRRGVANLAQEDRPRVFFEVWDRPLMTAGPGTFLGEMVEMAGGDNVFADVEGRWVAVSPEAVLARDPEVVLTARRPGGPAGVADFAARPGWARLSAVRRGRVHALDGDLVSRPGPRLAEALEQVARYLHPGRFPGRPGAAQEAR